MKCAIVDVGSNTIRLSVYRVMKEDFQLLFTCKETAGLASYIVNHDMSQEGIMVTCRALNRFRSILEQFKMDEIHVFATASLRNIYNTEEVRAAIYQKNGYQIDVLSGQEEALYGFYGAMHQLGSNLDKGILFDIGGGSTEITIFGSEGPIVAESMSIGSLNLYNHYVDKIFPKSQEMTQIQQRVQKELDKLLENKFKEMKVKNKEIYGVGGTARAALKLINSYYGLDKENREIPCDYLGDMLKDAQKKKKDLQMLILKICPERVHTIIPGMTLMKIIVKTTKSKKIVVSKYGVREGYLFRQILNRDAVSNLSENETIRQNQEENQASEK